MGADCVCCQGVPSDRAAPRRRSHAALPPVARDPDKDVPAAPRHVAAMLRQETPGSFASSGTPVLPTNVKDAFQLLTSLLASPFVSGPAAGPVPAFVVDAVLDLPVPRLTPFPLDYTTLLLATVFSLFPTTDGCRYADRLISRVTLILEYFQCDRTVTCLSAHLVAVVIFHWARTVRKHLQELQVALPSWHQRTPNFQSPLHASWSFLLRPFPLTPSTRCPSSLPFPWSPTLSFGLPSMTHSPLSGMAGNNACFHPPVPLCTRCLSLSSAPLSIPFKRP